jgi:hypothetical protein
MVRPVFYYDITPAQKSIFPLRSPAIFDVAVGDLFNGELFETPHYRTLLGLP